MPQCQCIYLKLLFTTDMSRRYLAETRREPTYTDVGNADIAGADICHPWGLGIRIRPPRTVEVQVLQEQNTCPAADGLSKVPPTHVSRCYLWDSSDNSPGYLLFYHFQFNPTISGTAIFDFVAQNRIGFTITLRF